MLEPLTRDNSGTGAQAWSESSWASIQPSKELKWVPCYSGEYQCTRLQVPLDYHNPDDGRTAAIAIVRLPANVSSDSPDYRGPILFNPGGPGGSGVDLIGKLRGPSFRKVLGPQFDLVGFDPRGVQRSTPRIEFYKTPVERELNFHATPSELNSSRETVMSYWSYTKEMGALAYERGKEYLPHMTTDHVARDMLSIVQAFGREKLQYWGFSYGSVIGFTFAAMFPDKVERLAIDGIVDPEDYYTTTWLEGVADADKTLQVFFQMCNEAGPDSCAFYEDSVEVMQSKLERIYAKLLHSPILVPTNTSYTLLDYGRVHPVIIAPYLYDPTQWRPLATLLQALDEGNTTVLSSAFTEAPFECDCDPGERGFDPNPESEAAYICNDGDPVPGDLEAAQAHYRRGVEFSSFGSVWASLRIACNGWSPDIPKARFRGPFSGNTSFPLLIIGNTADPITPLSSAKTVSQNFPGSVVLTQDYPGHTTLFIQSNCTSRAAREYFVNGTMPDEGTVCSVDVSPFDLPDTPQESTQTSKRDKMPLGDVHLLRAYKELPRLR
ncbi:hypothetical protein V5O48_001141 [Marasmius crinis-equi]|uniref:Alpha/beta-hydrolase n=1 Tax=Marasmius crinis-equi TaxID=585013 RepID=A0ABR3FZ56_9AGAR